MRNTKDCCFEKCQVKGKICFIINGVSINQYFDCFAYIRRLKLRQYFSMKVAFIIASVILVVGAITTTYFIARPRFHPSSAQQQTFELQTTPHTEKEKPFALRKSEVITKPDGWKLPDISKLKILSPRRKEEAFDYGIEVYSTGYKTNHLQLPAASGNGTADPVMRVTVKELTVYDINDRTFCYKMLVWHIPPKGYQGVGANIYQFYYDLDGDGKFET